MIDTATTDVAHSLRWTHEPVQVGPPRDHALDLTARAESTKSGLAAHPDRNHAALPALLRLDTIDPPGRETIAATYLQQVLEREGIPVQLFAAEPDRANLVARLKGNGNKRPLLLMGHTDVVRVDPKKWTSRKGLRLIATRNVCSRPSFIALSGSIGIWFSILSAQNSRPSSSRLEYCVLR
jgi:hypothetical protein